MFRIDAPTNVASLPTPAAAGTAGYFRDGDLATGLVGTRVTADFLNAVQEELIAVILAGGLTPSKTVRTQVRDAINALISTAAITIASTAEAQAWANNTKAVTPLRLAQAFQGANQSLATSGYQKIPGGLILQWGVSLAVASTDAVVVTLPIAAPTAIMSMQATAGLSAHISGGLLNAYAAKNGASLTTIIVVNDPADTNNAADIWWWVVCK